MTTEAIKAADELLRGDRSSTRRCSTHSTFVPAVRDAQRSPLDPLAIDFDGHHTSIT
jgi:hypothetical protein